MTGEWHTWQLIWYLRAKAGMDHDSSQVNASNIITRVVDKKAFCFMGYRDMGVSMEV
jgi:hypothetical protein